MMMKALLTLAIACGGIFHVLGQTTPTLAQTQTLVKVTLNSIGTEEKDQLVKRDRGINGHSQRRYRPDARLYTGVTRTTIYAGISPSTQIQAPEAILISARPNEFVTTNKTEPGDNEYGHPYVKKEDINKNYLVMYTAEWCGFCQRMYPAIKSLRKDDYIVYVVDADIHPNAVKEHQIESLPTFILMNKGKEVSRIVGACLKGKLKRRLKTRKEQEKKSPKPELTIPKLY